MKSKFIVVLCIGLLIMVSGCTEGSENVSPVNSPTPTIEEIIPTQAITPTETKLPPTPGPTPTWTLLPKLPQATVNEKVKEFYENVGDCELPCWWGIIPGETTLEEVYETYVPLGDSYIDNINGKPWLLLIINMPEEIAKEYARIAFEIENNVVQGLSFTNYYSQPYSAYTLSDHLLVFEEPSHIYVEIHRELIFFTLLYPDIGLRLRFWEVPNELLNDTKFVACPQSASNSYIKIWVPRKNTIEEIIANEVLDEGWPYIFPLEEVTDLTVTDFYNTYVDPYTDYCVSGQFTP